MKANRLFWTSSTLCLLLASCEKKGTDAAAGGDGSLDALAAERAALEDERTALERERLEEERAALEEEKEALRAEREARLAAREEDADELNASLEERQREIDRREAAMADRESELVARESELSEQEYVSAGNEALDDWDPGYLPEAEEPVTDYRTFYDDLQSLGSWYETPDYGYVFQPTVVIQDRTWRPYTRGRWVCTNLGWNWCSDEPFGWACFHYGRWCILPGRGWVWVPGDEWAPSWVCWREGGDHVGWAPLPPETLCYRGRGWGSSVETEFGIARSLFTFVRSRHMAEPLWKHCLPPDQNDIVIRNTVNITNIQFHRNRIVSGGPRWEKLRRQVGKPWPVYQLQMDRLKGLEKKGDRNAEIRGKQLAVFAPNLNTRWNARLKPTRVAGKWEDAKLERVGTAVKPEWRERFREARQQRQEQAAVWTREHGNDEIKRKQLDSNRQKVAVAQEKLQVKQREIVENRRERTTKLREKTREMNRPLPGAMPGAQPGRGQATKEEGTPGLAGQQKQAAERQREARGQGTPEGSRPARQIQPRREGAEQGEHAPPPRGGSAERSRERRLQERGGDGNAPAPARPAEAKQPENAGTQATGEERAEEARRRQAEQAVQRQRQAAGRQENDRREQQDRVRRQQEQAGQEAAAETTRRERMEEARKQQQQQDAARQRAAQARRQQEEVRGNQARAEETNRRQQQQEETALQQERMREQQEESARQQEQRARQEEARRQAQERERQQQEERVRQQQERAREQQEERARQQEEARRQAEERARQQEEAQREQQERARQQQQERAKEQQEQGQRQRGR